MLTVAIIGAGPAGLRLALAAARAGYRVLLEDLMPASLHRARETFDRELGAAAARGVAFVGTIEDAVREADLAIDCAPDELESKLEILWLLDRMAPPRTVLATPTVNLSIADLAGCTCRADRCVGLAVDPRELARPAGGDGILVRGTVLTGTAAAEMVCGFWRTLGLEPRLEIVP